MRVAITGASGFIGRNAVLDALDRGWEVVGIGSVMGSLKMKDLEGRDGLTLMYSDLSYETVGWLANKVGPVDAIYNFASNSHVPTSISNPIGVVMNNVGTQLTMLEIARLLKPRLFVQLSTEGVYGTTYKPAKEWELPSLPSNPYAASKAAQEDLCIAYGRTYGVPCAIVNVVNVFGPGQSDEKFVPMIINKLRAGETIQVHGEQKNGSWTFGARAYEYVKNLTDALAFITEKFADNTGIPTRWHLGGLKRVDNKRLIEEIAHLLEVAPKLELVEAGEARPGYDACYSLDGSKIKRAGWEQPYTFEEGLKETVDASRS